MSKDQKSVLLATFVSLKTMADATPRITLDMQCTLAELASMGLAPGVPFGLARITNEAAATPPAPVERAKGGSLAKLAGRLCNDQEFLDWLEDKFDGLYTTDRAAQLIRRLCEVDSRANLDHDELAAEKFHRIFREPFISRKVTA